MQQPALPDDALLAIGLILLGVLLLVGVADAILLGLLILDRERETPRFAPRWSVVHVFFATQAWVLITLMFAIPLVAVAGQLGATKSLSRAGAFGVNVAWWTMPLLVIQNAAMVGVVLFLVRRVYGQPAASAGFAGWSWRHAMLGLGVALVAIPASDLFERLCSLAALRSISPAAHAALAEFQQLVSVHENLIKPLHSPLGLAALIAVIGVIGPFGEEVFFRGLAQTALRRRFGAVWAIVCSAVFFAVIHVNPIGLLPIFLMGLVLAGLYQRTGTLAAPFALHAANNTVAVLLAYFHPEFTFWPIIPVR